MKVLVLVCINNVGVRYEDRSAVKPSFIVLRLLFPSTKPIAVEMPLKPHCNSYIEA